MQYIQPIGPQGPANAFGNDYVDKNAGAGIAGSFLAADVPEHVQIELLNAIVAGGLTPAAGLNQLAQAIQSGKSTYAVATGTANAWTVAPSLAVPAYAAGRVLWVKAPATNTSTTVTANVSGLGTRPLKKADASNPAVGDLVSGRWYPTIDDGTNICVASPLPSDIVAASSIVGRTEIFTSPGTFTVPVGVTQVEVAVIGGGGGGGASNNSTAGGTILGNCGGGGGGGGYSYKRISGLVPGEAITVTVGAGGTAAANVAGGVGGTSSFGAYCTATGGGAGPFGSGTIGAGGSGGTGSGGDINVDGGRGGSTGTNNAGTPSQSEILNIFNKGAVAAGGFATASFGGTGSAGRGFGCGGAGASGGSGLAGGVGAAGVVIVRW